MKRYQWLCGSGCVINGCAAVDCPSNDIDPAHVHDHMTSTTLQACVQNPSPHPALARPHLRGPMRHKTAHICPPSMLMLGALRPQNTANLNPIYHQTTMFIWERTAFPHQISPEISSADANTLEKRPVERLQLALQYLALEKAEITLKTVSLLVSCRSRSTLRVRFPRSAPNHSPQNQYTGAKSQIPAESLSPWCPPAEARSS